MSSSYGFRTTLHVPFETAIEKTTTALKAEGFGILTEIDVKSTLKKKLDVDFQRYTILGACNPPLAYQALQTELEVGLLLPCNVIVYETGENETVVSIVDPDKMLAATENDDLCQVAAEAKKRLARVADALKNN